LDLFADVQKNENPELIVSKLLDYGTKAMYVDELEFADGEELTKLLYIVERVKSVNYGRNRAI
jgi:hypothetical protein